MPNGHVAACADRHQPSLPTSAFDYHRRRYRYTYVVASAAFTRSVRMIVAAEDATGVPQETPGRGVPAAVAAVGHAPGELLLAGTAQTTNITINR